MGRLGSRGGAVRGMTANPGVFGSLLVTALWLAAAGLLVAWWSDDATGWATLWEALAAASLALWALGAGRPSTAQASVPLGREPHRLSWRRRIVLGTRATWS